MPKPYKKYRSESFRLQGWDYRNEAAYFITICTKNREHFFGKCTDGVMQPSIMGIIAQGCWYQIPKFNTPIQLGEFVVMPNHVHGIIIISEDITSTDVTSTDVIYNIATDNIATDNIATDNIATDNIDTEKHPYFQKISPKSKSISRIIQQYKRAVTFYINQAFSENNFGWQSLFHDHIIRNDESFTNISNYIINNPSVWQEDTFFDSKNSD